MVRAAENSKFFPCLRDRRRISMKRCRMDWNTSVRKTGNGEVNPEKGEKWQDGSRPKFIP